MLTLKIGDKAPDFTAADQDGKTVKLGDFKGKNVVLYFYPKDSTPGCTTEACGFRDLTAAFKKMNAVVLGVSADSSASHKKFTDNQKLSFPLLSDPEKTLIKAYGAWGKKSLYGKTYEGILRSTCVIGPDGRIAALFPKVKPADHPAEVLEFLR